MFSESGGRQIGYFNSSFYRWLGGELCSADDGMDGALGAQLGRVYSNLCGLGNASFEVVIFCYFGAELDGVSS